VDGGRRKGVMRSSGPLRCYKWWQVRFTRGWLGLAWIVLLEGVNGMSLPTQTAGGSMDALGLPLPGSAQ
jgi:hypothetical protein